MEQVVQRTINNFQDYHGDEKINSNETMCTMGITWKLIQLGQVIQQAVRVNYVNIRRSKQFSMFSLLNLL